MSITRLRVAAIAATMGLVCPAFAADLPTKAPVKVADPPLFLVNENTVGISYQFKATNPGSGYSPKEVVSFTHFDIWAYGTNLFAVDWLKATHGTPRNSKQYGTPVAACDFPLVPIGGSAAVGCEGYTEIYGLFRSTLGWNQLSGSKMFAWGPLTNIEFAAGVDANTDNTSLGSAKRSFQGGLQFDFAMPYKGFLNASVLAYQEYQNDSIAAFLGTNPSGKVKFNTAYATEIVYVQPLGFLPPSIPLTYKAFVGVHGPKGPGETGARGRITEYNTQQTLSLDVGKVFWDKPDRVNVWAGYRWWKNKFGLDPAVLPFTLESTWLAGMTMAF